LLQVSGRLLETANWSRCAKSRVAAGPFNNNILLQVSGRLLETANWSRCAKSRVAAGHQPFLQLVLTCLRELEQLAEAKAKSSSASTSSSSAEDRDQVMR
jgi:hypothetical protein